MLAVTPKRSNWSGASDLVLQPQELWFQQNGATCDTAHATIDLLKDTFGDRLISRFGPVNWPPRSCDLTPLDYFLWGYVKSLVYVDKPQTLDHLEDNIRRVIADIRPQMLEKVIEIGRPDWTTSEPTVAVICQKSYLKSSQPSSFPTERDPVEKNGWKAQSCRTRAESVNKLLPDSDPKCKFKAYCFWLNCSTSRICVKKKILQIENLAQFLFEKGENASLAAEIVYGAVTTNYVQCWFRSGMSIVENVHRITEMIQVDRHVSSHPGAKEAWGVVGRLEGGQTQAEVAQAIEVSQSVISRIWNRFLETGSAG
ncbi:DUF4817 domain-containing protein [Trichonephila clavipes]|nr:DUF4817 domain-containing protein [Trichonephila clavipes]